MSNGSAAESKSSGYGFSPMALRLRGRFSRKKDDDAGTKRDQEPDGDFASSPQQLKWLLDLDLHKIAMQQLREQQYLYKKEKNTVRRSGKSSYPDDDVYVEETLHIVTLDYFHSQARLSQIEIAEDQELVLSEDPLVR